MQIKEEEVKNAFVESKIATFQGKNINPSTSKLELPNSKQLIKHLGRFRREFDFAIHLHRNPDNLRSLQVEYFMLNSQYAIDKYSKELPICVVAPGRNLLKDQLYLRFIRSIDHQNYSNYRLFIDDASTDDTYNVLKEKIQEFPRLQTRTTLIKNYQNIGALGNKYLTISNHC